jgi:hypothetical protein
MTQPIGVELVRAKPILMTFYDRLQDYPYTSTFYIRHETSDDDAHRLIAAVKTLSQAILGNYKIGYRPFIMPDFHDKIKHVPLTAMGTLKWRISYHNSFYHSRSHTIPAYKLEHCRGFARPGLGKAGDDPDLDHADWKAFLAVFKEICVSSEGDATFQNIRIAVSKSNWPPPGAKRR